MQVLLWKFFLHIFFIFGGYQVVFGGDLLQTRALLILLGCPDPEKPELCGPGDPLAVFLLFNFNRH